MTKERSGNCSCRWCAAPIPETPAPTMRTSTCSTPSLRGSARGAASVVVIGGPPSVVVMQVTKATHDGARWGAADRRRSRSDGGGCCVSTAGREVPLGDERVGDPGEEGHQQVGALEGHGGVHPGQAGLGRGEQAESTEAGRLLPAGSATVTWP